MSGCFHGNEIAIDPEKVAVYIRWSTDDQAEGTTLEMQLEACQAFLQSQGWALRESQVYVDDGYSGGNLDRPALTRLRQLVREGRIQCVAVFKIDRLSRSVIDMVSLVLREWEGKCFVKSAREPIDTTTAMGKQIFYMLSSFAEWERNVIRERTYGGKLNRARQGLNAGQKYPLGYRCDESYQGKGKRFALNGCDGETGRLTGNAALVRDLFDQFLGGRSLSSIARDLNDRKVPCPDKGRHWRFGDIARIIDNPIYCGRYEYGRKSDGTPIYRIDHAVPAIVTPDEWQMCRQIRQEQKARSLREQHRTKTEPARYLLSGIARCAKCGERIGGCKGKKKQYYVCTGATILKRCDCASMDKAALEEAVAGAIRDLVTTGNGLFHADETLAYIRKQQEQAARNLSRTRQETNALLLRMERVEQDYLAGELKASDYYRFQEQIAREQKEALERLTAAEVKYAEVMTAGMDSECLEAAARDLRVWETLPFERLRRVLMDLIADLRIYQAKRGHTDRRIPNPNEMTVAITPRTDQLVHEENAPSLS